MKKLMIGSALALAALAASPVFAATHHLRTHAAPMAADSAYGAYGAYPAYGPNTVIVDGRVSAPIPIRTFATT